MGRKRKGGKSETKGKSDMTPRYITVRGAFESLHGPWRPGVNMLLVNAFELDPFKGALAGFVPPAF